MAFLVLVVLLCGTALATLAPWPVQKEYYGVLAHWRMNDNQVAGAVAQYKLDDEAASTVVDNNLGTDGTFGHGNTDAHDTAAWGTNFGQSLEFDGTNDYINTGQTFQSTFRDSFSISLWVQPHDGIPEGGAQTLFGVRDFDGYVTGVTATLQVDGTLIVTYAPLDGYIVLAATADPIFSDGEQNWHNIVIVFDASDSIVIFVDGVARPLSAEYDGDLTGVTFSQYTNPHNLYLGVRNTDLQRSFYFDGRMDNVAIYPRALTAQDVAFIASCGTQDTESNALTVEGSDPDGKDLTASVSISNLTTESGQIGRSFALDGTNDYAHLDDDADLDFNTTQDFSISVWIKRGTTHATKYIVFKKSGAGYVLTTESGYWGGVIFLRYGPGGSTVEDTYSTGVDVQDGNWHHIVAVRDAGSPAKIYVDGVDRTYGTGNDAESLDLQTTGDFYVGGSSSQTYLWDGSLDDLIVFNRALTATEADALYDRGTQTQYARELSSPLYDWRFLEDLRFREYLGTMRPMATAGALLYPVVADYQSGGALDEVSPTTAKSLIVQDDGEVYMNNATVTLPLSSNYDPSTNQSWTKMCNPNNYRHFDRGSDHYYLDASGDFVLGYTVLPTQVDPYAQSYGDQKYGEVSLSPQTVAITGVILSEYFDGISRIAASVDSLVSEGGEGDVALETGSVVTASFIDAYEEIVGVTYTTVCGYEAVGSELFGCNGSMAELALAYSGSSTYHWELVEAHTNDPDDPDYYAFHPRHRDASGDWVPWVEGSNGQTVDGYIQAIWRRVPVNKHLDWSHSDSVKMWPGSNDEGKLPPGIEENKNGAPRDKYIRCSVDSSGNPTPTVAVSGTNSKTLADVKHIYEEHAFGKMSGGNWVPGDAHIHVNSGAVAYSSVESDTSLSGETLSSGNEQEYTIAFCSVITGPEPAYKWDMGIVIDKSAVLDSFSYTREGSFANIAGNPLNFCDPDASTEQVWPSVLSFSDTMEGTRKLNPWKIYDEETDYYRWSNLIEGGMSFPHTFEVVDGLNWNVDLIATGLSYANLDVVPRDNDFWPAFSGPKSLMQRLDPYFRIAGYGTLVVTPPLVVSLAYALTELVIESGPAWLSYPVAGYCYAAAYGMPTAVLVGGISYEGMIIKQQLLDLLDIYDNGDKVLALHKAPLVIVDLWDGQTMTLYGDPNTGWLSESKVASTQNMPAVIWTTKPHFHLYEWEEEMGTGRFAESVDLKKTNKLLLELFPTVPVPAWPTTPPNNFPATSNDLGHQRSYNQDRGGDTSSGPVYPQRLVSSSTGNYVDTGVGIVTPFQIQEPDYDQIESLLLGD
jgi:hypothetical protein